MSIDGFAMWICFEVLVVLNFVGLSNAQNCCRYMLAPSNLFVQMNPTTTEPPTTTPSPTIDLSALQWMFVTERPNGWTHSESFAQNPTKFGQWNMQNQYPQSLQYQQSSQFPQSYSNQISQQSYSNQLPQQSGEQHATLYVLPDWWNRIQNGFQNSPSIPLQSPQMNNPLPTAAPSIPMIFRDPNVLPTSTPTSPKSQIDALTLLGTLPTIQRDPNSTTFSTKIPSFSPQSPSDLITQNAKEAQKVLDEIRKHLAELGKKVTTESTSQPITTTIPTTTTTPQTTRRTARRRNLRPTEPNNREEEENEEEPEEIEEEDEENREEERKPQKIRRSRLRSDQLPNRAKSEFFSKSRNFQSSQFPSSP